MYGYGEEGKLEEYLLGTDHLLDDALADLEIEGEPDTIEDLLLTEGIEQCTNCMHWRLTADMVDDDPDFSYCVYCR